MGETVPEDLELDLQAEMNAVNALVEAISHCEQVQDYTTRGILQEMTRSEEEHVDWLETQRETINIIGLELYLNQQIHED